MGVADAGCRSRLSTQKPLIHSESPTLSTNCNMLWDEPLCRAAWLLASPCYHWCYPLVLPSLRNLITTVRLCAWRVKRLSPSICLSSKCTRLFAVLPLENRHEIALYRSASQFIFFERCLESRTSLLSSAMAMDF